MTNTTCRTISLWFDILTLILVAILAWSIYGCACMETFPFNAVVNTNEPLYLLNTNKFIEDVGPVICSCIDIPCTSTRCHQARYEKTVYEIGTTNGNIILTTQKSEKLEDEWGK